MGPGRERPGRSPRSGISGDRNGVAASREARGEEASAGRAAGLTRAPSVLLLALIRGYRLLVSPWLGRNCRYLPSCSVYAEMAIEEWGAIRGTLLAVRRVARCHPFSRTGLDLPPRRPVPPSRRA
ncbi:MAG: membrane protein insertion efficiency factor YidD [Acidobacteria bacterium]|nr:MAG: membrane protein insertion efficiency factor YidD [Acidobacteriota bacterium]